MKTNRQAIILNLIQNMDIDTQAQLMEELRKAGVESTQATLSRDIRDLHLIKEQIAPGKYKYSLPKETAEDTSDKLKIIIRQCVTKVDVAQNLLVIHTLPGLAAAPASALDKQNIPSLVGSLAGDDTAFFAMRSENDARELYRMIKELLLC